MATSLIGLLDHHSWTYSMFSSFSKDTSLFITIMVSVPWSRLASYHLYSNILNPLIAPSVITFFVSSIDPPLNAWPSYLSCKSLGVSKKYSQTNMQLHKPVHILDQWSSTIFCLWAPFYVSYFILQGPCI